MRYPYLVPYILLRMRVIPSGAVNFSLALPCSTLIFVPRYKVIICDSHVCRAHETIISLFLCNVRRWIITVGASRKFNGSWSLISAHFDRSERFRLSLATCRYNSLQMFQISRNQSRELFLRNRRLKLLMTAYVV